MFGFLKNILRRPVEAPVENQEPPAEMDYAPPPPAARASRQAPARQNGGRPAAAYQAAGYQNGTPSQRPSHQNGSGKGVEVPLQKILEGLPLELQPRVRHPDVGDATISIPLEKVLSQLSRGSVKLSFGELRQAAPGVFSSENDRDRVLVQLPLNEVLTQLNPALIARRRVQKQVEVPDDISSPFESQNDNFSFSVGSGQPQRAPQPQHPPPPQHAPHSVDHIPDMFSRSQHAQQPTPPPAPASNPFQPARPTAPQSPLGIPAGRNTITSAPTPQPLRLSRLFLRKLPLRRVPCAISRIKRRIA